MASSRHAQKVLAIVLAGGEGKRLMPLTADRAKPAVPFGGIYRLIDFALSNVVNSRYLKVVVLTQYKSHSLDRHIAQAWRMSNILGNYIAPVPAQQRVGKHWYLGSADAIYQSLNLIHDEQPDIVVVVGADHVYRMDFSQMVATHVESGAAATVAAIRQPISMSDQFGVIDLEPNGSNRIREFLEKPTDPTPLADNPDEILASMGNYVFDADALVEQVTKDAKAEDSRARHGRRHHAGLRVPGRGRCLRLQGQRGRRRRAARPGLLARRRDDRLVLRRAHGSRCGATDLQPLQLRVADPDQRRAVPARQVRPWLARPRRQCGQLDRLPRLRGQRLARRELRARPGGDRALAGPASPTASCWTASRSAVTR